MVTREYIYNSYYRWSPPYKENISPNHNNRQLQIDILNSIAINIELVRPICKYFQEDNEYLTAKKIWEFVKKNKKYVMDESDQDILMASSFLRNERDGDCKSYTTFISSILGALNIPNRVSFTCYDNTGIPSHVYSEFYYNDRYIPVDGVYNLFAQEKPFKKKISYTMRVNRIYGVADRNSYRDGYNPYNRVTILGMDENHQDSVNATLKEKWKNMVSKVKTAVNNVVAGGKKVLLAPARAAFLGLVELNVHKLANHLVNVIRKNKIALDTIWTKLGGDPAALKKAAEQGNQRKPIFGLKDQSDSINAITLAAALAAAVPVLVAIMPIIQSFSGGSSTTDMDNLDDDMAQAIEQTGQDPSNFSNNNDNQPNGNSTYTNEKPRLDNGNNNNNNNDGNNKSNNNTTMLVVAATALLLLSRNNN